MKGWVAKGMIFKPHDKAGELAEFPADFSMLAGSGLPVELMCRYVNKQTQFIFQIRTLWSTRRYY